MEAANCQQVFLSIQYRDLYTPSLEVARATKKKPPTFHYTGWLIGILIMVYYNPYITG